MDRQSSAGLVGLLFSAVLVLPSASLAASQPDAPAPAPVVSSGTISGVVRDAVSREPIGEALVILQCTCLSGTRETQTNAAGLFAFNDLPAGTFTVQVLAGHADVSKVTALGAGAKFRANFAINPKQEFRRAVRVSAGSGRSALYVSPVDLDPVRVPKVSPKRRLAEHRREQVAERDVPSAAPVETASEPGMPLALESGVATKPIAKDFARRILYTGTMSVAVFKLDATKAAVEKLVTEAGGYVQVMRADSMILRIPATDFRIIADKIGGLGRVDEQSFEALDVTEDYYDLDTRIEVLRRTQSQLMGLLDKSRTVAEALEVRAALDRVTLELESALGKQRVMSSQIQFSALTLSLSTRAASIDTPSTNDPFPWVDDIGVEGTAWR